MGLVGTKSIWRPASRKGGTGGSLGAWDHAVGREEAGGWTHPWALSSAPVIFPVDPGTQASRCVPSCLWRPLRVSWQLWLRGLPNYMYRLLLLWPSTLGKTSQRLAGGLQPHGEAVRVCMGGGVHMHGGGEGRAFEACVAGKAEFCLDSPFGLPAG